MGDSSEARAAGVFDNKTFTAPTVRASWFVSQVLRHLPQGRSLRVLDLGCGTGYQLFELAGRLPSAQLVGVDISASSIEIAHTLQPAASRSRLRFVAADYMSYVDEPFDAILSDSVLQNLEIDDRTLFDKIARDLVPGGLLIATIPYDGPFNRTLWRLRRALRPFRGRFTDGFVFALARLLHPTWPAGLISERVPYAYLLPFRRDAAAWRDRLAASFALDLITETPMPLFSLGQPRHNLLVFERHA